MKFDTIIQNPPYKRTLHLDFLEKGIELLTENGRMVIIEPSTWLINVRKNGKAKMYDEIKRKIKGHVESVVIENLNKEFGTKLFMPFSITTIDMSKTFDTIDFYCCGEHKNVKSLYNCNLIGEYETIYSIINKLNKYGDFMKNHVTTIEKENYLYLPYREIVTVNGYYSEIDYIETKNGKYYGMYITPCCHKDRNDIRNFIGKTKEKIKKDGKRYGGNPDQSVYGTHEELENWKHFVFNNKLPLFLNIVLTIDQHNNSKEFLPWLVDKKYTDEEINEMFGFTDEEIKLIDTTLKKYERNSPWFKRYMCGVENSATNEEIQNFINEIKLA